MVAADWSGDDGSLLLFTKSNAFSGHFSTYIQYIQKQRLWLCSKKIYLPLLFRQWQESIDIFNTHTGNFGFKVPALANLLVLGGRISQYIPPFGGHNIT